MKDVELIASYWTIAGGAYPHTDREYSHFDFKDRVEAIAKAGFKGMGIWHADLDHTLETRSLAEMKQILDDNGITHVELEFLSDWFLKGEKKKQSDRQKEKLFRASEALQANHIKVGDFFNTPCPMSQLIESFATLCSEAEQYDTRIAFEMMPFAMLQTLAQSLALVEGANANNGGLILDLWHIVKMKIPYDDIARIPARYIIGIEINDGFTEGGPWDLATETTCHRQLCGEGDFDIKGFIHKMLDAGYQGPFGIEVLSEKLREKHLEEITTRAFTTTMAQFN